MAYISPNLKTKKAVKEALAAGKKIVVFNPGLGGPIVDGSVTLEGPHYPEPHRWYAQGVVENGFLKSIK